VVVFTREKRGGSAQHATRARSSRVKVALDSGTTRTMHCTCFQSGVNTELCDDYWLYSLYFPAYLVVAFAAHRRQPPAAEI